MAIARTEAIIIVGNATITTNAEIHMGIRIIAIITRTDIITNTITIVALTIADVIIIIPATVIPITIMTRIAEAIQIIAITIATITSDIWETGMRPLTKR